MSSSDEVDSIRGWPKKNRIHLNTGKNGKQLKNFQLGFQQVKKAKHTSIASCAMVIS